MHNTRTGDTRRRGSGGRRGSRPGHFSDLKCRRHLTPLLLVLLCFNVSVAIESPRHAALEVRFCHHCMLHRFVRNPCHNIPRPRCSSTAATAATATTVLCVVRTHGRRVVPRARPSAGRKHGENGRLLQTLVHPFAAAESKVPDPANPPTTTTTAAAAAAAAAAPGAAAAPPPPSPRKYIRKIK
jgi:hypothetical protein